MTTQQKKSYCGWCQLQLNEGKFKKIKKEKNFKGQWSKKQGLFILVFYKQNLAAAAAPKNREDTSKILEKLNFHYDYIGNNTAQCLSI